MNVPLPDGSVARVEYVGDVAPKVTVAPRARGAAMGDWGPQAMPFPSFAGFDRMIEQMQRQSQEMMRRAQEMSRHSRRRGALCRVLRQHAGGADQHHRGHDQQQWPDLHALDRGRVAGAGQATEGHVERQRPVRGGGRDADRADPPHLTDGAAQVAAPHCLFGGRS